MDRDIEKLIESITEREYPMENMKLIIASVLTLMLFPPIMLYLCCFMDHRYEGIPPDEEYLSEQEQDGQVYDQDSPRSQLQSSLPRNNLVLFDRSSGPRLCSTTTFTVDLLRLSKMMQSSSPVACSPSSRASDGTNSSSESILSLITDGIPPSTSSSQCSKESSLTENRPWSNNPISPSPNQSVQQLLQQKNNLNDLLNAAMTKLYSAFGTCNDPSIQRAIHSKLNHLRSTVGSIEETAVRHHIQIDSKMDDAQKTLTLQLNAKRSEIRSTQESMTKQLLDQYLESVPDPTLLCHALYGHQRVQLSTRFKLVPQ